jgi:PAS domain S-box-containing protein
MRKILAIHSPKDPPAGFVAHLERLIPGSAVVSAHSWEEGLEQARRHQPDLVVMEKDIHQRIDEMETELAQRRELVAELKRSEERYRQLIHSSNDGIYLLYNRKFEVINETFTRMLGVTLEDVNKPGFDFLDLVAPRSREFIEERHRKINRGETVEPKYEFTALARDGREIELEASISLIKYKEGFATQGVLRDITGRKQYENRLRRTQKIEALSTLAGGIAHDFNNILAIIRGYTELVLEDVAGKDALMARNLQHVVTAADRAKELVNQILTFSRQGEGNREAVNIDEIAGEVVRTIRATLPDYMEISESLHAPEAIVLADPGQIRQMVVNLCANALHAMRETGGVLEVKLEELDIAEGGIPDFRDAEPGPYAMLTVKDPGHGMGSAVAERIFEPYFTTKATGEGSGMGLAVIYGIVKSYGGEITVLTEPEKGTTFHLYLPRVEKKVAAGLSMPGLPNGLESLPGGDERILLVEEGKTLLHMQREILEPLGYHVVAVSRCVEALDVFRADAEIFDLVITDQNMRDMTGLELSAEMLKIRPGIPVILCTGFGSSLTRDTALKAGVKGFIMKPVIIREIAGVIRKVLGRTGGSN